MKNKTFNLFNLLSAESADKKQRKEKRMINAEMVYQKIRQLDQAHLQETFDFIEFLLEKIKRDQAHSTGIKSLLLAMPAVGEDEDFKRRQDYGRTETSWDI